MKRTAGRRLVDTRVRPVEAAVPKHDALEGSGQHLLFEARDSASRHTGATGPIHVEWRILAIGRGARRVGEGDALSDEPCRSRSERRGDEMARAHFAHASVARRRFIHELRIEHIRKVGELMHDDRRIRSDYRVAQRLRIEYVDDDRLDVHRAKPFSLLARARGTGYVPTVGEEQRAESLADSATRAGHENPFRHRGPRCYLGAGAPLGLAAALAVCFAAEEVLAAPGFAAAVAAGLAAEPLFCVVGAVAAAVPRLSFATR